MSTLPIIKFPDPILRQQAEPLEDVGDDIRKLLDDMLETMYEAPGVGLAGPQVAVMRRVLVMDISRDEEPRSPICMVNPEIVELGSQTRVHEEGCLSIPTMYAEVERPASCRVRYIDRDGVKQEMLCEGMLATVVQHEVDHLDGVLFIDHISRLRRERLVKKFLKGQRTAAAL